MVVGRIIWKRFDAILLISYYVEHEKAIARPEKIGKKIVLAAIVVVYTCMTMRL